MNAHVRMCVARILYAMAVLAVLAVLAEHAS